MRARDRHAPVSVIPMWLSLLLLVMVGSVGAEADPPPSDNLVREYLDTPDAERADRLLSAILADPRYSPVVVRDRIRRQREYGPAATGVQPNQPLSVGGRSYSFALSVPENYQPSRDYGLVICLHGAGFTGEAYLDRWKPRLGDDYILACPTYGMGAWWNRSAEELVLATMRAVWSRYRIDRKTSNDKWEHVDSGESRDHFLLVDDTGQCVISPDGAHAAHLPYGEEGVLVHEIDPTRATGLIAGRYAPERSGEDT